MDNLKNGKIIIVIFWFLLEIGFDFTTPQKLNIVG